MRRLLNMSHRPLSSTTFPRFPLLLLLIPLVPLFRPLLLLMLYRPLINLKFLKWMPVSRCVIFVRINLSIVCFNADIPCACLVFWIGLWNAVNLNRQFIFPVQSVELSLNFLSRLNIFIAQVVVTSKLTKLLSVGIVFVLFVSVLFKNDLYSIET